MLPDEREECAALQQGLSFRRFPCPCINCLRLSWWAEVHQPRNGDWGTCEEMVEEACGAEGLCDEL